MSVQTRDKRLHYLNTGASETPIWSLVNEGVTTMNDSLEMQSEDTHFVAEQNARTVITGFKPQFELEAGLDPDDAVAKFLYEIGANQQVGVTVEMVSVDTWDGTTPTFTARKALFQVQPTQAGSGDPGSPLTYACTLAQVGDQALGEFNIQTKTWTDEDEAEV